MRHYFSFPKALKVLSSLVLVISIAVISVRVNLLVVGAELFWTRLAIFLGKLHPALVHFPLGLLLTAILIEGYITLRDGIRGRSPRPSSIAGFCVCFGALGALVAAGSGWINASHQQFYGNLESVLFWHRWLGVSVVVLSVLSASFYLASSRLPIASVGHRSTIALYLLSLFVAAPLLGVGAHFGGVMVHGEDYFAEVFELPGSPTSTRASADFNFEGNAHLVGPVEIGSLPLPVGRTVDFTKEVFPILKRSCFKCHGGGRDKGGFRLDSRSDFLSSGKNGPSVVPGDSGNSRLIHLISGLIPDNVMPEKGRRLTDVEVSILRAWIDQGLNWEGEDVQIVSARTSLKLAQVSIPDKPEQLNNPIDRLLEPYLRKHQVVFPNPVSDELFARRAYLDIVGLLPTVDELQKFKTSRDPEKRTKLIDRLLSNETAYADHWLSYWNDLLRNDYSGPGFQGDNRKQITSWLRRALVKNMPYDRLVSSLIAPSGRSDGFIKGIVWSGDIGITEQPAIQAAQNIGQVFLGINLKCATCHDSFTDEWTMEDTYGIANVYAKQPLEIHECEVPTGKVVPPGFLFPSLGTIDPKTTKDQRAKQLASLLVSPDNGRFSRTLVNRMWKRFFGRGIVEPVDEMSEKPWNSELLDWLSKDFVEHEFNLKHLMRRILTSESYQMKSVPAEASDSKYVFQGPVVRRLTAEQFMDSFHQMTGAWGELTRADLMRMAKYSGGKEIHRGHTKGISIYSDPKELSVSVEGAKTLWLVVNVRDPGQKRGKKLFREWAVWAQPELELSSGRKLSLTDFKPIQAFSSETSFSESGLRAIRSSSSKPILVRGEPQSAALAVKPFSVIRFDLESIAANDSVSHFRAQVGVESKKLKETSKKVPKLEFIVLADVGIRAAHFSENPLLNALGRPKRDQVTTSRDGRMTTLQALTLTNSSDITKLVADGAKSILARSEVSGTGDVREVIQEVYLSALGRKPSQNELNILTEFFKLGLTEERLEDFLWSMIMLPEFQLIV